MCHEYTGGAWNRERMPDDEDDEETPEFLNEEGGDVEVLTDGGE
jgi:hypothetical protein